MKKSIKVFTFINGRVYSAPRFDTYKEAYAYADQMESWVEKYISNNKTFHGAIIVTGPDAMIEWNTEIFHERTVNRKYEKLFEKQYKRLGGF